MDISLISNSALRIAIQRNLVSFPSQVPALMKRPGSDSQERIAQLYFALGWTVRSLCERYCLSKAMVQKVLSEWRVRAIGAGYIQDIHPDELELLICVKDEPDAALFKYSDQRGGDPARLLHEAGRMASHASA